MKEALFYEKLENDGVGCIACRHFCRIPKGGKGICGVRENRDGSLYSLTYGKIIAKHVDPIEKKPLFHFLPGSRVFSFAAMGCNFRCWNCQNAEISQIPKNQPVYGWGRDASPEGMVREALESGCKSIACTYTEPTVFVEFALETMKLAKKEGLKNIWVSNGYMSEKVLEAALPYLDAVNVDLKFFDDGMYRKICGAGLGPVLENLKLIKESGTWLEATTLAIPGFTDKGSQLEDIAKFIAGELGKETPWHVSRFHPAYKLTDLPPTPTETVHRGYEAGKKAGLKYVYTGNLLGDDGEDTHCPECHEPAVNRRGYEIERLDDKGRCAYCGANLNMILK